MNTIIVLTETPVWHQGCHLRQYGFSYQLSQLCLMIIFDTSCGARRFHITNYFRLEVD